MHLIPAGIIQFPKKEIKVTQYSKFVPTKIDFCGTAIAQNGNDRHSSLAGITVDHKSDMPNLVNFSIDYESEMPILILFPIFSQFSVDFLLICLCFISTSVICHLTNLFFDFNQPSIKYNDFLLIFY